MARRYDARGHLQPVNRHGTIPVCADCMRLHRRLESSVRQQRRVMLGNVMRASPILVPVDVQRYAAALFDHLTLVPKVRTGKDRTHPAPAAPEGWSAQTLEAADRAVLTVLHLWNG